jgi:hypothetical protein
MSFTRVQRLADALATFFKDGSREEQIIANYEYTYY